MSSMHQIRDRETSQEIASTLSGLQGSRSDGEMAGLLGITRTHWAHIKAGRRFVTYAIVKRASRAFPEVLPIVMRDLAGVGAA